MNNQKIHPIEDYVLKHKNGYIDGGSFNSPHFTSDIDEASVFSGTQLLDNDLWRHLHYKAVQI